MSINCLQLDPGPVAVLGEPEWPCLGGGPRRVALDEIADEAMELEVRAGEDTQQ